MRFGRRNKSRPVQTRREVNSIHDGMQGAVASEERDALLFQEPEEKMEDTAAASAAPEPAAPVHGMDPTQRLLTALGRFHRYVAKGQAGAPQEFWSDDCMNQILAGVELAVEQDWKQIVEALTGTARVLQTYENASAAHLCVAFLNDSYEVLCLMVGDLIVNNTRSGAMENWRKRYERAVTDLTAAGLTLMDDDDDPRDEPVAEAKPEPLPFAMPDEARAEQPEAVRTPAEDEPSIDDFLPFVEETESEPDEEESASFTEETPASFTEETPEPFAEDTPEPPADEPETAQSEPRDEVVSVLDAVCDDLARLEKAPPEAVCERLINIGYRLESLHGFAVDNGWDAAGGVSDRMLAICRRCESLDELDASFIDLAYAFCSAYVDAIDEPEASSVAVWLEDSQVVLDRLDPDDATDPVADSGPAPQHEPAAAVDSVEQQPPQPEKPAETRAEQETAARETPEDSAPDADDGSPESLLVTAQKAIAHGDMPAAKVLALQAVAHLARAETARAEARVQEAEKQFQQNALHIDEARQQVKKAEQEVMTAENRASEGGSELADARAHCSLIEEKMAGIEKRVAEIEEQLRALQAARESELQRVEASRGELDQARDQENQVQNSLRQLKGAESDARSRLEEARQNIKDLQRGRLELEEMLSRARETLTHHRSSMGDIEKTIMQLRPAGDTPAEEGEELLF